MSDMLSQEEIDNLVAKLFEEMEQKEKPEEKAPAKNKKPKKPAKLK